MKKLLVLLLLVTFTSCKLTWYQPSSRINRVEQVLGVTTAGDTIQVPIDYFGDRVTRQYDFDLDYFYWRNSWWNYNPNLYNRSWFYRSWWWNPYTPMIIQNPRPRYSQPRVRTRRSKVRPQPNRGRSNQKRKPKYVRPNTRSRVTTPPPTHSNRNSTVRRSNTNSRTRNGRKPIKQ